MNSSLERARKLRTAGVYAFFIIGSVVMIFPFVWMLLTSFKTVEESMIVPPTILPEAWQVGSYIKAMASLPFLALYRNTALMIFWRVVCAVLFSSMAGYAFAKLKFKGKNVLFSLVLIQMMLPSQIFITPQYQMLARLGLTNTIFALVFPGLVSAFGTFFLRQAYLGIPDEISEAAYLDGCTQWQAFTKIMAPLTKSAMSALAVFTAVFAYGDLMWPLIVNTNLNMMTLSSGLATLRGQFSTDFPTMMAGSLLAMVPMVILYLLFQKQFIEGVAMTGGK